MTYNDFGWQDWSVMGRSVTKKHHAINGLVCLGAGPTGLGAF